MGGRHEPEALKYKNQQNVFCHNHVFFEGFRPNGLQIRIRRIFLRLIACVKIDFDDCLHYADLVVTPIWHCAYFGVTHIWHHAGSALRRFSIAHRER